MPIVNILKRASNYILGSDDLNDKGDIIYEDNEVLFCKNNVCVHPPAFARQESDILHYPGYLTVTTKTFIDQYNNAKRPTLMLTWIPNATLRKCPSTVENGLPPNATATATGAATVPQSPAVRNFTDELKQNKFFSQIIEQQNNCKNGSQISLLSNNTNPFLDPYLLTNSGLIPTSTTAADNSDAISTSSNSDRASSNGMQLSQHADDDGDDDEVFATDELKKSIIPEETEDDKQLKRELEPLLETDDDNKTISENASKQNIKALRQQNQTTLLTSVNITIANPRIQNHDLSPEENNCIQQQQQREQQQREQQLHHQQDDALLRTHSISSVDEGSANWMTPELFAYKHNLSFPDSASASPVMARKIPPMKCRRFSVDLSQMRSLRLFFNDEQCTSGQLVIASRESQYKILHFHHGGLDHLAQVLHQWHCLLHNIKLAPTGRCNLDLRSIVRHFCNLLTSFHFLFASFVCVGDGVGALGTHDEPNQKPYRQFMVCRPEVKKSELHPDEGNVNKITTDYFYGTLLNEKGQIEDDLLLRKCVFFGGLEKSLRKTVWPFLLHCYSFNSTFEDRAVLMDIRNQVRFSMSHSNPNLMHS